MTIADWLVVIVPVFCVVLTGFSAVIAWGVRAILQFMWESRKDIEDLRVRIAGIEAYVQATGPHWQRAKIANTVTHTLREEREVPDPLSEIITTT